MIETVTIPKNKELLNGEDYKFLREKGIEHIQKLAGKIWTDHNVHDPGITILELLSYAMTDLAYRTSFPMKDLVAFRPDDKDAENLSFHTAANIFPNNPVTLADFRKVFIDIEGVQNAWLICTPGCRMPTPPKAFLDSISATNVSVQYGSGTLVPIKSPSTSLPIDTSSSKKCQNYIPIKLDCQDKRLTLSKSSHNEILLKGLYTVKVLYDEEVYDDPDVKLATKIKVAERAHHYRNLCEDFCRILDVQYEDVALCMELEVKPEADVNLIMAQIIYLVERHLNPSVNFYSMEELLDAGQTPDQIFEGPTLDHGFIDDDELAASQLKSVIYTSDLYNIIMDIEGVVAIKKLLINKFDKFGNPVGASQEWCLFMSDPYCSTPRLDNEKNAVSFFKGLLPFFTDPRKVEQYLRDLKSADRNSKLGIFTADMEVPRGEFRDLEEFYPVSNEFPLVYGIGIEGLPPDASEERIAKARQLKAYLLFFEQFIANYLSQLANVRELFTWREANPKEEVIRTYFSQKIDSEDFNDINSLYNSYGDLEDRLPDMLEREDEKILRRNRFLDHLLARFSEEMTEYSLILYSLEGDEAGEELLRDKARLVRDYPLISRDRGKGFDMLKAWSPNPAEIDYWNTGTNVTGYQKRICRAIGIDNYDRRFLSVYDFIIDFEKPGAGAARWKYVFEFTVKTASGEIPVTIESKLFDVDEGAEVPIYHDEWDAENALEKDLQYLANPFLYIDDDPSSKFKIQNADGEDLSQSLEITDDPTRALAMQRAPWYFIQRQRCYPDCLYGDIIEQSATEFTFNIIYYLETSTGLQEIIITNTEIYATAQEAFEASLLAMDELCTAIFRPHDTLPEVFVVEDKDGNIIGDSGSFLSDIQRDEAMNLSPEFFKKTALCDENGLHVVEHLIIRPHSLLDEDALLQTCVHCPDGDSATLLPSVILPENVEKVTVLVGGVPNYGFNVWGTQSDGNDKILLKSVLYPNRYDRDKAFLLMYEYGPYFENYVIDEATKTISLLAGPDGDVITQSCDPDLPLNAECKDYTNIPEEMGPDVEALKEFFFQFINTDILEEVTPEVEDPCDYENDPYSYRLSVVASGWTEAMGDPNFRRFAEDKIRLETPAHIYPKICWISRWQMRQFEICWKEWLVAKAIFLRAKLGQLEAGYSDIKLLYTGPVADINIYLEASMETLLFSQSGVNAGDILTLEAGTELWFEPGTSVWIEILGALPFEIVLTVTTVVGDFTVGPPTEFDPCLFYHNALKKLVDIMSDFRNISPAKSRLHDCSSDEVGNRIILDHTNLGNT